MIPFILFFLGLCLGSFVNAWVWRIHKQVQASSNKQKRRYSILHGRSMCVHCSHELAATDLVPVVSWLLLGGKCRYCKGKISWQYPAVELVGALSFLFSYYFWPESWSNINYIFFGLWLVELVVLLALTVFDIRWRLLPNRMIIILLIPAFISLVLTLVSSANLTLTMLQAFSSIVVGGGVFWMIFQVSNGKWIGGGDVKLGAVLGLILSSPTLAFMMIFLASVLGTITALPFLTSGRSRMKTQLPYGPSLILATIVLKLWGASLIAWYRFQTGI